MFCPLCGRENAEDVQVCNGCGQPVRWAGTAPPNHLGEAILCTLFCFMPFGVVAIVYAAQVNGHLSAGNVEAARYSSEQAQKWTRLSFWCWLGVVVLGVMLAAVGKAL